MKVRIREGERTAVIDVDHFPEADDVVRTPWGWRLVATSGHAQFSDDEDPEVEYDMLLRPEP